MTLALSLLFFVLWSLSTAPKIATFKKEKVIITIFKKALQQQKKKSKADPHLTNFIHQMKIPKMNGNK